MQASISTIYTKTVNITQPESSYTLTKYILVNFIHLLCYEKLTAILTLGFTNRDITIAYMKNYLSRVPFSSPLFIYLALQRGSG